MTFLGKQGRGYRAHVSEPEHADFHSPEGCAKNRARPTHAAARRLVRPDWRESPTTVENERTDFLERRAQLLRRHAELRGYVSDVANGRSNSVSVIDTRTNERIADIPVGEAPWGVVIR